MGTAPVPLLQDGGRMTPTSRSRITAASLSETLDTKGPFAAEDARRMAELDAAMAGDPYVEGWRKHKATVERRELDELRAAQADGCCAVCASPLPPPTNLGGKPRRLCDDPECKGEYERAARRMSRQRVKARREV